jgi:spermidine synthase
MSRRNAAPYIVDAAGLRSLHFGPARIQSRMRLAAADELVFDYTRVMMAFLLFRPMPARIALIGLGGGSLAKFCHRHLPRTRIDAIELDARVIALRDAFAIPRDDRRLRIRLGDGVDFVARQARAFDAILLDGYDEAGMPARLRSAAFADACRAALRPRGVLVVNVDRGDPGFSLLLRRLRASFDDAVLVADDDDRGNAVVLAGALVKRRIGAIARPANLDRIAWAQLVTAFARVRTAQHAWLAGAAID